MLKQLHLLAAEIRRELIIAKRYWPNFVSFALQMYIMFIVMILAGSAMGGGQVIANDAKGSALVGLMMWALCLGCVSVLGWSFFNEAATGTLEHLYLSPLGAQRIFLARSIANFLSQLLVMIATAALVMLTTGVRLHLPLLELAVILPLSAAGMYGFGFLLAALTLTVKRTQQVMNLIQFFFLFFTGAMAPLEQLHPALRYFGETLPLTAGVRAARAVTVDGASLVQVSGHLAQAAATALIWLVIGLAVFTVADRRARLKGNIGQY